MVGQFPGSGGGGDLSGRLVRVLTTVTVTEGLLARGILEAEGVPVLTKGEGEGPYRMGPVQLWVPEEFEVQARLVLEGIPTGGETQTAEREADEPSGDPD